MMTGFSIGSTTRQKIWRGLAPSTTAARTGFSGIALRPESRMRKNRGVQCQTSVTITAIVARCALRNHSGAAPAPNSSVMIWLIGPFDWNSIQNV